MPQQMSRYTWLGFKGWRVLYMVDRWSQILRARPLVRQLPRPWYLEVYSLPSCHNIGRPLDNPSPLSRRFLQWRTLQGPRNRQYRTGKGALSSHLQHQKPPQVTMPRPPTICAGQIQNCLNKPSVGWRMSLYVTLLQNAKH